MAVTSKAMERRTILQGLAAGVKTEELLRVYEYFARLIREYFAHLITKAVREYFAHLIEKDGRI